MHADVFGHVAKGLKFAKYFFGLHRFRTQVVPEEITAAGDLCGTIWLDPAASRAHFQATVDRAASPTP